MNVEVTEKSLELALTKAARQLNITQSELAYEVLQESAGFLGLFGKKVAIKAWKKSKHSRPQRRPRAPRGRESHAMSYEPKEAVSSEQAEKLKVDIEAFIKQLCKQMVGSDVKIKTHMEEDRFVLNIQDEHLSEQMRKSSKLVESFEHLARKLPVLAKKDLPFRIFVDALDVRKKREAELYSMAIDLSNKVSKNKKPVVLNYKSPYDRKIIHMALDQDKRVFTKSIGTGPNRKLMILPNKQPAATM